MKLGDSLNSPAQKRCYNEWVFSLIASEYDVITRVLSFWRDAAWKRLLVGMLPACAAPSCLDLACGTGDLCGLLAGRYPDGLIAGVDIADAMLAIARRRHPAPSIRFLRQDMGRLEFPDASIDRVTGSYALRNAPDLPVVLREVHRVLKPGGTAAFLDFSKSPRRVPRKISYGLLKIWGGFWGLVLHGNPEVYGYIAESLKLFPDRVQLRRAMEQSGLHLVDSRLLFFGMLELTVVERPAGEGVSCVLNDSSPMNRSTCIRIKSLSENPLVSWPSGFSDRL